MATHADVNFKLHSPGMLCTALVLINFSCCTSFALNEVFICICAFK